MIFIVKNIVKTKPFFLQYVVMEKNLIQLVFQSEIIRNHGDKFTVGGLAAVVLNGRSEIGIECIHVASVPRDLDRMADGTLDAACRSLIFLCNRRVEDLSDRVDDVGILDGKEDRRAEILISLYVGGNTDLMNYSCDLSFYVGSFIFIRFRDRGLSWITGFEQTLDMF